MSDKKSKYVGLWFATNKDGTLKLDKSGNNFFKGFDKETNTRYFVFGKPEEQRLCIVKDDGPMETIGNLELRSNDNGEFKICNGHIISENRFYEERPEGQPQLPEYQVKLPE